MKTIFAKAYAPRTKGKIEEFIGFVERDIIWEVKDQVKNLSHLQTLWKDWYRWYDHRRPRSSLGDLPPARRYRPCQRAAPPKRKLLQVEISRLVRRDATITLRGRRFAVPPEFMGKHVWVGLLGDDITIEHAGQIIAAYTR